MRCKSFSITVVAILFLSSLSIARTIAVELASNVTLSMLTAASKRATPVDAVPAFAADETDPRLSRWYLLDESCVTDAVLSDRSLIKQYDILPERTIHLTPNGIAPFAVNGNVSIDDASDPFRSMQWQLDRIMAEPAWRFTRGSANVVVAVIDVGTDISHPDLSGQLYRNLAEVNGTTGVDDDLNGLIDDVNGWDFARNDANPSPDTMSEFHGTHVAGIVASAANGRFGVGVAPNVKLLPLRAGIGLSVFYGYRAIYFARRMGADIVNLSWGGSGVSAIEAAAVEYALEGGVTIFASAGNDGTDNIQYPSGLAGVISVGASNRNDTPASFSNSHASVAIWAPGVQVGSTMPNNGFSLLDGTSMASPVAAGVGALLKSYRPSITTQQIRAVMTATGDPMVDVSSHTAVRVNAYRAINEIARNLSEAGSNWSGSETLNGIMTFSVPLQFTNPYPATLTLQSGEISGGNWLSNQTTMQPDGSRQNWSGSLTFQLPMSFARGHTVSAGWTIRSSDRSQWFGASYKRIAPPEATIQDNSMRLTFSTIGALGLFDPYSDVPVGVSLQAPPYSQGTIYHGSFMLGAPSAVVLDNVWGNDNSAMDWEIPFSRNIQLTGNPPTAISATASPTPGHSTMNVVVDWRAVMVSGTAGVPAVDIIATIRNAGNSQLSNLIAAWMIDFDIGNSSENTTDIDASQQLLTIGSAATSEWYNVQVNRGTLGVIRTPTSQTLYSGAENWNDARKYELITWSGAEQAHTEPNDYVMLFATNPFNLASGASSEFGFRLFKTFEMQQAAELTRAWRGVDETNTAPRVALRYRATVSGNRMQIVLPEGATSGTATLFDVLGRTVWSNTLSQSITTTSLTGLPYGAYFLRTSVPNQALPVKKIVYLQ
ncbi:MAG: S8 family serine peptidase [bacterium]|nr:S8 family serine peptidase [bacterium]